MKKIHVFDFKTLEIQALIVLCISSYKKEYNQSQINLKIREQSFSIIYQGEIHLSIIYFHLMRIKLK